MTEHCPPSQIKPGNLRHNNTVISWFCIPKHLIFYLFSIKASFSFRSKIPLSVATLLPIPGRIQIYSLQPPPPCSILAQSGLLRNRKYIKDIKKGMVRRKYQPFPAVLIYTILDVYVLNFTYHCFLFFLSS